MKISDSGLIIYEELPFISVTLYLEVECKRCGSGLVEIKVPLNRDEIPSADHLGYLKNSIISDNKSTTVLKTNESNYYQVQGQLGVTSTKYYDFFVMQQLFFI